MIRYFLQPIYGPWYEIDESQWDDLIGVDPPADDPFGWMPTGSHLLKAVYVNTALALKADVEDEYPGLQDLIWFPDMRCGDCNGRLIDLNESDPEKRYPNYAHATAVIDRHGAWPVERWDD